jgi:hypothetical protein
MTHWILVEEPRRRARKRQLVADAGKPLVTTHSFGDLKALHRAWGL